MASVFHRPASTPKQAARRRAKLDGLLDPALFKVIGEPTRAKLLACLVKCGRPCSVTEVAECCSIDFSMVARHLAALARAGLLEARKEGRTVWYQARAAELSARFHEIGEAIAEWSAVDGCDIEPSSGSGGCCK